MNALCFESHIYTIGLRHWIGLIRLVKRNAMKVAFAIVQLHRNLLAQRRKHIDFVRNAFRFDHNLILIKNMQKRAKNKTKIANSCDAHPKILSLYCTGEFSSHVHKKIKVLENNLTNN